MVPSPEHPPKSLGLIGLMTIRYYTGCVTARPLFT